MKKDALKNFSNNEDIESEDIIFVLKQSPSFFGRIFFICVVAIILIFISFYFWGASKITSYIILVSVAVIAYYFSYYYYRWSRTMYILTNDRIIAQKQTGWFAKILDETNLDNIRFVSHSVKGINQHILNTGNVFVRSSVAESGGLKMENIANPYDIQKTIIDTQKKHSSKVAEGMSEKDFQKEVRKKGPVIR